MPAGKTQLSAHTLSIVILRTDVATRQGCHWQRSCHCHTCLFSFFYCCLHRLAVFLLPVPTDAAGGHVRRPALVPGPPHRTGQLSLPAGGSGVEGNRGRDRLSGEAGERMGMRARSQYCNANADHAGWSHGFRGEADERAEEMASLDTHRCLGGGEDRVGSNWRVVTPLREGGKAP